MAWWVYDIREGSLFPPSSSFFFRQSERFRIYISSLFPPRRRKFRRRRSPWFPRGEYSTPTLSAVVKKGGGTYIYKKKRKSLSLWLAGKPINEGPRRAEGRPRVFSPFIYTLNRYRCYIYICTLTKNRRPFLCFLLLYVHFFFAAAAVAMSTTEGSRASRPYFFVVLQYDEKKKTLLFQGPGARHPPIYFFKWFNLRLRGVPCVSWHLTKAYNKMLLSLNLSSLVTRHLWLRRRFFFKERKSVLYKLYNYRKLYTF